MEKDDVDGPLPRVRVRE
uniref:Uncharacterized protein n=1 Tax=Arundo donax TaxID=35708 RepID=A0A0A9FH04_ARUDO